LEIYSLSYNRNRPKAEIEQMPVSERDEWRQFFQIRDEEIEKEKRKAKRRG